MNEYAPRRRATLACGSDRAKDNSGHCEFQVGLLVDNDCVIAAELEQTAAHAGSDPGTHLATHRAGSCKGQQVDSGVVNKLFRKFVAAVIDQEKRRRQRLGGQRLIDDLLHGYAAQRGFRRRLPDVDVAADCGNAGIPGPDRDGEIKRGDRADQAERMPLLVHAMCRTLRVHGLSVEHAGLADREIRDINHFLDFTDALGLDLAVLERYEPPKRVPVLPERIANQAYRVAANRCRNRAPLGKRLLGPPDDFVIFGRGRRPHACDHIPGRGINRFDQGSRGILEKLVTEPGARVDGFDAELFQDFFHRNHLL